MRKRSCVFLLALLLVLSFAPARVHAASGVTATIPTYTWELGYHNIGYKDSLYPPLNYRGVTYFPMTWGYCRLLGLTSVWVEGNGLFIAHQGHSSDEIPSYEATRNPKAVTATIPTYPIYVNGEKIDNSKEEYPLLNFRGVTYFPMTWRFAREEFNWDTDWSEADRRFSIHWGIDSNPGYRTDVYEQSDTAAFLVKFITRSVPIGKDELGYTVYTVENSQKFYTLDFATGKLIESEQRPSYERWAKGETNNLPVGRLPEGVSFRTEIEYTDDSIPAPYTPFVARAYVTVDGKEYFLGEGITVTDAVWAHDFVFFNAKRYTGWKGWTNPNYELYRIDIEPYNPPKEVSPERIDTMDHLKDFGSMKLLGYNAKDGQLYLKCQQGSKQYSGEGGVMEASAYNDGYYTMNVHDCALRPLHRFVYTDGDILTPNGQIYGIFDWKNTVERLQANPVRF